MQPSKILTGVIIVLATVIGLSSLALPLFSVQTLSTSTHVNSSTLTSVQMNVNTQTTVTTILIPYSTFTSSYYTAYFLCDPAAMGCPGPPVSATTTYLESSPSVYPALQTTLVSAILLTLSTTTSTLTNSQNIPAYSILGLTDGKFATLAGSVIAILATILVFVMKRGQPISESKPESTIGTHCEKCEAELNPGAKFCGNCGAAVGNLKPL